ncbi:hypothetical protein CG473_00915 [Mycoplasma testudineum]|nr:hypothetical protein CG473_00915 [Mycoplasma testudineum]
MKLPHKKKEVKANHFHLEETKIVLTTIILTNIHKFVKNRIIHILRAINEDIKNISSSNAVLSNE